MAQVLGYPSNGVLNQPRRVVPWGGAVVRQLGAEELVSLGKPGQGFEVLTAEGLVGNARIAKGHPVIAMSEELHDAHEAHAAVEEGCRKAVPQPMGSQAFGPREISAQFREDVLVCLASNRPAPSVFQKPRTGFRSSPLKLGYRRQRTLVERYEAFVVQLAKRDLEEVRSVVVGSDTFPLEVAEFANTKARTSHQVQAERD